MGVFTIPAGESDFTGYTLGPQVKAWMESYLVFGPGDIRGEPYSVDSIDAKPEDMEKFGILCRAYELLPPGSTTPEGRETGGRRRFRRVGLSVRKGWAKTEFAAAVTAAELHPSAPVRFSHWAKAGETSADLDRPWYCADGNPYVFTEGEPVGKGVKDPYIPMVAYTEEQSEELAYGALKVMLEEGPLVGDFDIAAERILVLSPGGQAAGKAVALASSPDSRDGARTTFQVFDETHRMVLEKLIKAHQTMLANIPKRYASDAWTLEITTSYEPGLGSVAEGTMEYARMVAEGKITDSRLFFYHRQADDKHRLRNEKNEPDVDAMRAAVIEASGPAAVWTDIDGIVELGLDPQTPQEYWERVWLNRPVQQSGQAFPMDAIDKLAVKGWIPPAGDQIVLGFDGAQVRDTTAIVGTHLASGRQFLYAIWQNPGTDQHWKVPPAEVDQAVAFAFNRWDVWRMYADPYYWDTHVADWVARYMKRGETRVFEWPTNTHKRMALSLKAYIAAMREGVWTYDGNDTFRSHLANARKHAIPILDEDGVNLFLIRKERPDSPLKIDAAMAGCLSYEAYRDAVAAGVTINVRSRTPVTVF
jgi:hypothetical protein